MKVKQISVFLENKSGWLAEAARVLGESGINIRALSIADTTDFGILRLIVSNPDLAYQILKEKGFTVSVNEVIVVEVIDEPGGLAGVLSILRGVEINIEYLYAFVQKTAKAALVVFRVEQLDETIRTLQENGVRILGEQEVYTL
ncbi:MAG: amino acid-binding protein [Armatimonadetes bacterium]|nr:amino acid-binding protein [Armatimonadota bacterium]